MKKIIVFTEGQGELIFIRHILCTLVGYQSVSFECFNLISNNLNKVPYPQANPNAVLDYLLVNVGTDESVLSVIKERCEYYLDQGYEIIGLRDMYSERYKRRSPDNIDQATIDYFRNLAQEEILKLKNPEKIHFFFSIMELEAWLLGFHRVFERLNPSLTVENIRNQLGIDLDTIDPETTFFHPAINLARVLDLAGINYRKHKSEMEGFVSHIRLDDINWLQNANRCSSLVLLIQEIERGFYAALSDS